MTASPLGRYRPKNGPLATFDELLLVRGMNRRLLYGEEEDKSEAAGLNPRPTSIPLSQIATLYSRASETDHSGRARIRLNDPDPVSLFRALRTEFGEPFARFVIALRLFGTSSVVSQTSAATEDDIPAAPSASDETNVLGNAAWMSRRLLCLMIVPSGSVTITDPSEDPHNE